MDTQTPSPDAHADHAHAKDAKRRADRIMARESPVVRCRWCGNDPLYIAYHDTEWGVPSHDAGHLFEKLVLEGFQAGLSWITVLRKRDHFRKVMHGFDPHRLAVLSDAEIDALMQDPGIIRNRMKLNAARLNARAWLALEDPVSVIWSFVGGAPIVRHYATIAEVPATSEPAQRMSRFMKTAGFRFVGPTICHAYLQSIGCLMEHTTDCFRHAQLAGSGSR